MRVSLKTLMAAALLFGGTAAMQPSPASAQPHWGPRYRPVAHVDAHRYAARPWVGTRRAYYGPRYGRVRSAYYGRRHYGRYPHRYYRRGYNGGAVAAGLIGGLALGAIASAAANPYYYGGYPYSYGGYYGPSYYQPAYYRYGYYQPTYYTPVRTCFTERRRIVNRYGRVIVQRVQTCY